VIKVNDADMSSGVSDMQRLGERIPSVQDASMSRRAKAWMISLSICISFPTLLESQLL